MDEKNNMSFFNLSTFLNQDQKFPIDHFIDRFQQEGNISLKMINTFNNFTPNDDQQSQVKIENQIQDSLGERIQEQITVVHSSKKKKSGCICKKTHCLKNYCECFLNGKICGEHCGCLDCKNTHIHQFQIAKAKHSVKQGGIKSCSLSEKRCNCKKSHCLKRYCQCYNSGVGCSSFCKCQSCENRQQQQDQNSQNNPQIEKNRAALNNLLQKSQYNLQKFYQ